jgi:mannose-6-phosphate isomerase-like protein (cupin superfamily)
MKIKNLFEYKPSLKQNLIKWTIFLVFMLMIPCCLWMGLINDAKAHDDQKPNAVATKEKHSPFSFTLPSGKDKYTEIMKPPVTVHMRSGLVKLAPAQDVGLHSTRQNEEMLVILEGQGKVEMEGYATLNIKGGQTAYVPPQTQHNVRNTGSVTLKYIFIVSKAIYN